MYCPSSENKGADQLRGYRGADSRLCNVGPLTTRLISHLWTQMRAQAFNYFYVTKLGFSFSFENCHFFQPSNIACNENKGADQLRGYREADLRLCFRIYAERWPSHDATQITALDPDARASI